MVNVNLRPPFLGTPLVLLKKTALPPRRPAQSEGRGRLASTWMYVVRAPQLFHPWQLVQALGGCGKHGFSPGFMPDFKLLVSKSSPAIAVSYPVLYPPASMVPYPVSYPSFICLSKNCMDIFAIGIETARETETDLLSQLSQPSRPS